MTTAIFLAGITIAVLVAISVLVVSALGMRGGYRQDEGDRRHG